AVHGQRMSEAPGRSQASSHRSPQGEGTPVSAAAPGYSLRLRLLAGTLAWMLAAIALLGWGLRALFQDHIRQQLQAQLVVQLDQLSAAVEWSGAAVATQAMVGDPKLGRPLSGLYWQIDQ